MDSKKKESGYHWSAFIVLPLIIVVIFYVVLIYPFVWVNRDVQKRENLVNNYVNDHINEDYIVIEESKLRYLIESDNNKMVVILENEGFLFSDYKVVDFYPYNGLNSLQQKIAKEVSKKYNLNLSYEEVHKSLINQRPTKSSFDNKLLFDVEVHENHYIVETDRDGEILNIAYRK
ncbi:hypothetical protein M3202_19645 [Alkalihalobacillus oceani]|uniref:Uncharacterized protein n=1 Tax=Halalkalibacter oceani TaxID=1653776 RepID=A0A9X2DSF0_9BACI|nr:hypothetical protein [Halalkalibacter oceani]MCM3716261.1 hypothetical protein [Halalkalibacter oceani]